jgi:hypothetical protein
MKEKAPVCASRSLKYEVSLALCSASRLLCCVPEAAAVNPGNSKITHEPASISVKVRFKDGFSVDAGSRELGAFVQAFAYRLTVMLV